MEEKLNQKGMKLWGHAFEPWKWHLVLEDFELYMGESQRKMGERMIQLDILLLGNPPVKQVKEDSEFWLITWQLFRMQHDKNQKKWHH